MPLNQAQQDALRFLLITGAGSGLLGAGSALYSHMTRKQPSLEDLATSKPELVSVPYPKKKKKEDEEKTAGLGSWLLGEGASHWSTIPAVPLALMTTAMGGTALAHHLADKALKEKRRKELEQDVESAEEDYKNTLLQSYDKKKLGLGKQAKMREINEGLEKLASILKISEKLNLNVPVEPKGFMETPLTETIGSGLSYLGGKGKELVEKIPGLGASAFGAANRASQEGYQAVENALGLPKDWQKAVGGIGGGLALLMLAGVPIGTGLAAYKYFKNRSKEKLLNEAAKARQYARLSENIPEPYVAIEE